MKNKKEKAFSNWQHNSVHLTFPNGNKLSTIWGCGSYSENHSLFLNKDGINNYEKFLDSDTCEIMIMTAPDELIKKIHKKYNTSDDSVIGYLTMTQWLDIVKMLSK